MSKPEKECLLVGEKKYDVWDFGAPMMHEDWHKAEEMGLVYLEYAHHGSDYWDDQMLFCRPEDLETLGNRDKGW